MVVKVLYKIKSKVNFTKNFFCSRFSNVFFMWSCTEMIRSYCLSSHFSVSLRSFSTFSSSWIAFSERLFAFRLYVRSSPKYYCLKLVWIVIFQSLSGLCLAPLIRFVRLTTVCFLRLANSCVRPPCFYNDNDCPKLRAGSIVLRITSWNLTGLLSVKGLFALNFLFLK